MDGPKPPPPGHPSLDPIHSGAARNSEISSMESTTNQNLTSLSSELRRNALPVHTQNSDSMVGGQKLSNHHSTNKPANGLDWKGNKMGEYGSNVADQANRGKAREEVTRPQQQSQAESLNGHGYQMRLVQACFNSAFLILKNFCFANAKFFSKDVCGCIWDSQFQGTIEAERFKGLRRCQIVNATSLAE